MRSNYFPSIWLGNFHSKAEWDDRAFQIGEVVSVIDWIDDRMLYSRHPFSFSAYCSACGRVTKMNINWTYGGIGSFPGSVNPAWTETCVCEECGLNSRMRALFDLLNIQYEINSNLRIYIAEQTTPFFQKLKHKFPSLMGSEYLGADRKCGEILMNKKNKEGIRHEDITKLSFVDKMFDIVITQDVFEHIPNYRQAFSELWRVLSSGGSLVFSIPFFFD